MTIEEIENWQAWCFEHHIYFYGYSEDCPPGYYRVLKIANGVWTYGQKLFPHSGFIAHFSMLYRQVYMNNNRAAA